MKTIATLFSGGELFGVGAKQAGYEHIYGIEFDDKIASVARLNGFDVLTGDVREVGNYESLPSPDHLHASPPCPNFSVAKQNGGETEKDIALARAVCWFIESKKPKTVSIENVTAYRKSQSFKLIVKTLEALGYFIDIQNLNSADFGVPQTRKRMILRASKQLLRPYPDPVKWVGWYEAIEDLIPTLPETQFAQWQIDRLPELYKNFLIGQGTYSRPMGEEEPAHAITANSNQGGTKAFLLKGSNINPDTFRPLEAEEPHSTVTATMEKTPSRAFVVNTKEPHGKVGKFTVKEEEEPLYTLLSSAGVDRHKAFIVAGGSAGKNLPISDGDNPVFTIKGNAGGREVVRAYEGGRVVKMTIQALGRFQTVPDSYVGMTTKINGNGVPVLLARRIMESLL